MENLHTDVAEWVRLAKNFVSCLHGKFAPG